MKKGYTLVELLIVLAVIAALMAVATPMALSAVKQAKASQVAQNLNALKSAAEQYVYNEKVLPQKIDDLKTYMSQIPEKYVLGFTPSASADNNIDDGTATIIIGYNGGDVLVNDVKKQYSAVEASGTVPVVLVQVSKWW